MGGERIGPYRIERELGSGGMGTVFAATVEGHCPGIAAGERVALKVVHPHLLEQPGFFRRFLREADIGASVRHPNVVRTYVADAIGSRHLIVMELVEGRTLRDLLDELDHAPEELCRHVGREVAKGLRAMHDAGVVHRDLKPENVLITGDHAVKIMDLGVARLQDEVVRLSQTGLFVGSVRYASPEQFGRGEVDHRADLYALGLVLYELACGTHPFDASDYRAVVNRVLHETPRRIHEINPQLSPFYEEVVHTLLAKSPEARFADAGELLDALNDCESGAWWQERTRVLRLETRRPLRRVRVPRETRLCGREPELDRLCELYMLAAAGRGQVVLMEGEAGIGKTRLVDELVDRLQQDGEDIDFLFGSYPPAGATAAAGAWSTAFREHFGSAGSAAYLDTVPLLAPAFDAVLRGEPAPGDSEPLTPQSLGTCFVEATRAVSRERTTIVLIDDLHFAPEEARGVFTTVALAVPEHRVLLIGTTRPGVPEDWIANISRLDHATHLTLERLGPKDLTRLLVDAFRSERLAEELGFRIAQMSDGNPFFVFEIIRGLRDGQLIARGADGSWVSTGVIDDIRIPSSVLDLVSARVSGLSGEERNLLDVASCCGYSFDPLLVGRVLDLPRLSVLRELAQIERQHRLVRAAGRQYVFDHHQVQEALYGSLSELLREEYHAALASALEAETGAAAKEPGELGGALCLQLCEHLLAGAQGQRAARYLDAALLHLQRSYLNARVVALADEALAVPELLTGAERARVLLTKADRLDVLGRREPQESALREALEIAEDAGEAQLRVDARRALAWCLICQSRYDEAETECERTLALCRASGNRKAEAMVTGNLGTIAWYRGHYEEAREHFTRHMEMSRDVGDRLSEAKGAGNLGVVLRDMGRLDEAGACVERHLAISREIGYRGGVANATGNLGLLCWSRGDFEAACAHYERQLELTREIGDRRGQAAANGNLGLVCKSLGRLDDARERFERHLAISREIGDRRSEAIALVNIGGLLAGLGAAAEARAPLEECLRICEETGATHPHGYALHALGDVALQERDAATARRRYGEALELRRRSEYRSGVAESLLALAAVEAGSADPAAALPLLEEAESAADRIGTDALRVVIAALRARVSGDATTAARLLADHGAALGPERSMQVRLLLFEITGERAHIEAAKALLDEAAERAPTAYRDAIVTGVPLHRDIDSAWRIATGDEGCAASESATRATGATPGPHRPAS